MKTSEIIMIISGVLMIVFFVSELFFIGTPTFNYLIIAFIISLFTFFISLGMAEYETFFKN
jgi:hypothetical protein